MLTSRFGHYGCKWISLTQLMTEYVNLMSETCNFVHKTQSGIRQGTLDPKKVLQKHIWWAAK